MICGMPQILLPVMMGYVPVPQNPVKLPYLYFRQGFKKSGPKQITRNYEAGRAFFATDEDVQQHQSLAQRDHAGWVNIGQR